MALIPLGFILPHLPWFNQSVPATPVLASVGSIFYTSAAPIDGKLLTTHLTEAMFQYRLLAFAALPQPVIAPATTTEIAIAGALLLFCLLLIVSALPMAVLAWKGRD